MITLRRALLLPLLMAAVAVAAPGHEGMWLFNNLPREQLKKRYDFDPSKAWVENLQKSSIRFPSGSGSFISPDGLAITNHHVGAGALQKLGTKDRNLLRDGYHARTRKQELKCEAMELNVLQQIIDVTQRVNKAVPPGTPSDKAAELRRAEMSTIEKEAKDRYKLKPQVVTLYRGARYHLYLYKAYTDIRLVFAPEQQIAFFGGDPDNFEYPRYNLDICIFRVYEDDKPIKVKHYLKWAHEAVKEGDLVFVSGHPGRTDRLNTLAHLRELRDVEYPFDLRRYYQAEVLLQSYSDRSDENRRQARDLLFGVQNSRKAVKGMHAALLDPKFLAAKEKDEIRLRAAAENDAKLSGAVRAWDRVAGAIKVRGRIYKEHALIEEGRGLRTSLYSIARHLVRAADERAKPNKERLREYTDARLDSLTQVLFSKEPIYDEFEIANLADSMTLTTDTLGHDRPVVQIMLGGKAPEERAAALVRGTKLKDVAERKRLYQGGQKAILASKDPLIVLARAIDPHARAVRKVMDNDVTEVLSQAYGDIARVKFAVDGTRTYPDATFTLRLSYGVVKGYEEAGQKVPYHTLYRGLYQRAAEHHDKPPFDLPPRWVKCKDKLDLEVPFNFVSTNDIIGGNSGSPVVNRAGEFAGIIFDGNIQSLSWRFVFHEDVARSVSVDAQGILEALRKVYEAGELVSEITGK